MSRENELDLDAILAEFHRQDQSPSRQEAAPTPRRRREERLEAPREPEASALAEHPKEPRPLAPRREDPVPKREPQPAAPKPANAAARPRSAAPDRERPVRKAAAPKAERETGRRSRAAEGRRHMAIVLAALAVLLAGLLFWTVRAERQAAALEPEPVSLELGQQLEEYLNHAATTTR